MKTPIRRNLTPFLALLSLGCAASPYSTTGNLPPVPAETIEVFLDRQPHRPYAAVGRFTIEADSHGMRHDGAMLAAARETAAAMGANAILASPAPARTGRFSANAWRDASQGGRVQTPAALPAYDVTAVVWRCDRRSSP